MERDPFADALASISDVHPCGLQTELATPTTYLSRILERRGPSTPSSFPTGPELPTLPQSESFRIAVTGSTENMKGLIAYRVVRFGTRILTSKARGFRKTTPFIRD
jgi:hypothetical protein